MRKFLTLLAMLILVQAAFSETRTVMVDGYCYLEGRSVHSETKVKFIKVSPSAITDSTYTDSSGYFFISGLYAGIYDVEYTHIDFETVIVEDVVILGDMTLPPQTLLCARFLSDSLSGTLGPGCYRIVGDITINPNDSLHILPGTSFMFIGPYAFRIYGTLLAEGTESDSIKFTTDQSGENRWRGLRFEGAASSGSRLAYCPVERSYDASGDGGGVYCSSSSPTFTNCTVIGNSVSASGYRSTYAYGGGIYCSSSSPAFTNCTVSGNSVSASGYYNSDAYGGGVYCSSSSPAFTNCTISGNSVSANSSSRNGYVYGGGVWCYDHSSPTLTNCTISGNSARYGGGVYCSSSSPTFENCILSGNSAAEGGGALCWSSSPIFNSTIIAFSTGSGIRFENSASSQISYCDFFGNSGGNIGHPSQGPPMIGVPLVINANADSADIYMNISLDPMFADTAAGDYHLTDFSHCIGAGDPADTVSTDFEGDPRPNPSWSYPDIGADEHWSGSPVLHLVVSILSGNARLHWTPFGAGPYSIYGATEPYATGTLLATVSDTTTWTDEETASRPSRYFYYVTSEWPSR
ncbi:MAG: right-handed parallel beta-helix repeat-containing protein [bacterium]